MGAWWAIGPMRRALGGVVRLDLLRGSCFVVRRLERPRLLVDELRGLELELDEVDAERGLRGAADGPRALPMTRVAIEPAAFCSRSSSRWASAFAPSMTRDVISTAHWSYISAPCFTAVGCASGASALDASASKVPSLTQLRSRILQRHANATARHPQEKTRACR